MNYGRASSGAAPFARSSRLCIIPFILCLTTLSIYARPQYEGVDRNVIIVPPVYPPSIKPMNEPVIALKRSIVLGDNESTAMPPTTPDNDIGDVVVEPRAAAVNISHSIDAVVDQLVRHGERVETITPDEGLLSSISEDHTSDIPLPSDFTEFLTKHRDTTTIGPNKLASDEEQQSTSDYGTEMTAEDSQSTMNTVSKTTTSSLVLQARDEESSGNDVVDLSTIAPSVEIASAIDGDTPSSAIDESSITIGSPHEDEESDDEDSDQTTLSAAAFSFVTTAVDEPLPPSSNETIVVIGATTNASSIEIDDEEAVPVKENSSAEAALQLDETNLILGPDEDVAPTTTEKTNLTIEAVQDAEPTTAEKTNPIIESALEEKPTTVEKTAAQPAAPPSAKSGNVVVAEKKASAAADHAGLIGPAGSYGEVAAVKPASPPSPRPNEATTTMVATSDKGGIEEADLANATTTTVSVAEQSEETSVTGDLSTVAVESTSSAITTESSTTIASIAANETSPAASDQTTTTMLSAETTTTASSGITNQTEEADVAAGVASTTPADVAGANEITTTDAEETSGMSDETTTTEITTIIEMGSGDGATTNEAEPSIETITTLQSNESMTTIGKKIEEADVEAGSTTTPAVSSGTSGAEADVPDNVTTTSQDTTTQVSIGVEHVVTTEEPYGSSTLTNTTGPLTSIGVEHESTTMSPPSVGAGETTESSATTMQMPASSTVAGSETTTRAAEANATTETIIEIPQSANVTKGPLTPEENPYEADIESTTKAAGPPGIDPNRVIVIGAVEPQTTTTTIAPSTEIGTTTAATTDQSISGEMIELTTVSTIASETLSSEPTEINTSTAVTMPIETTVQPANITGEPASETTTTTVAPIENVTVQMGESSTSGWRTVTANVSDAASTTLNSEPTSATVGEEQSYGSSDTEQTTTAVTTDLSMADAAIGRTTTIPILVAEVEQNATTTGGGTQQSETTNVSELTTTVGSETNVTSATTVAEEADLAAATTTTIASSVSADIESTTSGASSVPFDITTTTSGASSAPADIPTTTSGASSVPSDITTITSGASSVPSDILTTTTGVVIVKLSTTTVEMLPDVEENPYGGGGEPIVAVESATTTTTLPIESSTTSAGTTTTVVQSTTSPPIPIEEADAASESSGTGIETETTLTTETTVLSSSVDTPTTDAQDNKTVSNGGRPIATVVPSGYGKNETEEDDVEGSGQALPTTQMPGASDHTIELESTTIEEFPSAIEPSGYGDSGPAIKLPVHSSFGSKLVVVDDEARAVHTRVIEDEARVRSREVEPPATLQNQDDVEDDFDAKSRDVENSLKLAVGRLVVRRNLTFASPITPRPVKLFHAVTRPGNNKAHASLLHSDLLLRQKWQPYHMNCTEEIDERGEYCRDWALGGLCDTHRPTMFLFCRRTCLCTGPPSPDDDVRRRRWRS